MILPAPLFVLKSSSDSTGVSTHTRLHHRQSWRRSLLAQLAILGLLLALVVAQSNDGTPASSPPAPQPGPNLNNQIAIAPSGESPTPTQTSDDKHHDSATASATVTGSAAPPKPTTITTVSVINGTTTTLTLTITPAQAAAAQPPPPTSIPKAPQSVLVVQSISYGKVLPAAGPADDHIESHFWDQFLPKEGGTKASDGSLSFLWRGSSESTTLVWTVMMVIVTVALLSR